MPEIFCALFNVSQICYLYHSNPNAIKNMGMAQAIPIFLVGVSGFVCIFAEGKN
jgi:hypothetical protein